MDEGTLTMPETRHPKSHVDCPDCSANHNAWEKKRILPQIGQTFECADCKREVYVYDVGGQEETVKQWRPVTDSMATNLLFFAEVGDWPDKACEDLFKHIDKQSQGIDYHMVEREGLSQSEWADRTERSKSSVSENVSKAKQNLTEE